MMNRKLVVGALTVFCFMASTPLFAMKMYVGGEIQNPEFECDVGSFTLVKGSGGALLTGSLKVPGPGYQYFFSDVYSASSGPSEVDLKIVAPSQMGEQTLPMPDLKITHLFPESDQLANINNIDRKTLKIHIETPFTSASEVDCVLRIGGLVPDGIQGDKK